MEELRAMAGLALDGVPVETRVVFGEPAEEIAIEAECFDADLVVVTESPRWRLRAALAGLMPQGVFGRPFPARVLHMPA